MNSEQKAFINAIDDRIVLHGCPGAGKSTTCITKILTQNITHFLYLLFNKNECDRVWRKFKKLQLAQETSDEKEQDAVSTPTTSSTTEPEPEPEPETETEPEPDGTAKRFSTIHSLALSIVSLFRAKVYCDNSIVCQTAVDVLRETPTEILEKRLPRLRKLQYIFVDEAQDLSQDQIDLVESIVYKFGCKLNVVGDRKQFLYRFRAAQPDYFFGGVDQGLRLSLNTNYRSTTNIIRFINALFEDCNMKPSPDAVEGSLPRVFVGSSDDIYDDVVEQIRLRQKDAHDIYVIAAQRSCKDDVLGLSTLVYKLEEQGIQYKRQFKLGGSSTLDLKVVTYEQEKVNLFTVHTTKGREIPTVIFLGMNQKMFSYSKPTCKQEIEDQANMLFVALSRSQRDLLCYVHSEGQAWHSLYDVDPCLFDLVGKPLPPKEPPQTGGEERDKIVTQILNTATGSDLLDMMRTVNFTAFDRISSIDGARVALAVKDAKDTALFSTALYDYESRSTFYGNVAECLFNYFICRKLGDLFKLRGYLSRTFKKHRVFDGQITLDAKHLDLYKTFVTRIKGLEKWEGLLDGGRLFMDTEMLHLVENDDLNTFLRKRMKPGRRYKFAIRLLYEVDDDARLLRICDPLRNLNLKNDELLTLVLKMNIYLFHKANSLYLADADADTSVYRCTALSNFVQHLSEMVDDFTVTANLKMQYSVRHPNLRLKGEIDLLSLDYVDDKKTTMQTIIDVKFVSTVTVLHFLQLLVYSTMVPGAWKSDIVQLKIINLNSVDTSRVMYTWTLKCSKDKRKLWCLVMQLAKISKQDVANTRWVFDLETTGLNAALHEITERHVQELNSGMVMSSGFVQTKHPIPPRISDITGITDADVSSGDTKLVFVDEVTRGLSACKNPVMIAHNAAFDQKFLSAAGVKDELYRPFCTLKYYRKKRKRQKNNLSAVYEAVLQKKPKTAHRASADVDMLTEIIRKDSDLYKLIMA